MMCPEQNPKWESPISHKLINDKTVKSAKITWKFSRQSKKLKEKNKMTKNFVKTSQFKIVLEDVLKIKNAQTYLADIFPIDESAIISNFFFNNSYQKKLEYARGVHWLGMLVD